MTTKTETCPRCAVPMTGDTAPGGGALSRVDNTTYICSVCGEREALFTMFRPNTPLPPVTEPIPAGRSRVISDRELVSRITGFSNEILDELGGFVTDFIAGSERDTIAKVFNFAVVLREADAMPIDEDEYWERPWKWDREYQAWQQMGAPWPPEPGEDPRPGWEDFVNELREENKQ